MELLCQRACPLQQWKHFAGVEVQLVSTGMSVLTGHYQLAIDGIYFDESWVVLHWMLNTLTFTPTIASEKILLIYTLPKVYKKKHTCLLSSSHTLTWCSLYQVSVFKMSKF